MSEENTVVPFGGAGGLVTADQLAAGLDNIQQTTSSQQLPYLRMQRDGVFCYGTEKIEVEEGSEWAINPATLMHGWACWSRPKDEKGNDLKGELLGEEMVPFHEAPIPKAQLENHGYAWTEQVGMVLQCVSGEDEGVTVMLKGTSLGLKQAVHALTNEFRKQLAVDAAHIVPIIRLDNDSYNHKEWGKTYTPVLTVLRWVDFEGNAAGEAKHVEAPAKADPAEEEVPSTPPKRRRRRG